MDYFTHFPEDIEPYYRKYIMHIEKFNYASKFLEKNNYSKEINIEKYGLFL